MNDGKKRYITELREVRREEGTYRTKSSKSDDYDSDLLRHAETNTTAGPTESRAFDKEAYDEGVRKQVRDEVEEEVRKKLAAERGFEALTYGQQGEVPSVGSNSNLDKIAQLTADIATDVIVGVGREVLVPYLRDTAIPSASAGINEFIERLRSKAEGRRRAKIEATELKDSLAGGDVDAEPAGEPLADVDAEEPKIPMSQSEYLRLQLELKLTEERAAKLRWLADHAAVEESEDEHLTPELQKSIALVLAGKQEELQPEEKEAVMMFLRRSREEPQTVYAPPPPQKVRDVPRSE